MSHTSRHTEPQPEAFPDDEELVEIRVEEGQEDEEPTIRVRTVLDAIDEMSEDESDYEEEEDEDTEHTDDDGDLSDAQGMVV